MLWASLLLAACGAIPDGEGGEIYYLGAASHADQYSAPDETDIVSRKVKTVGVWIDVDSAGALGGLGLGYRRRELMVLPLDCRVVFRIANAAQLQQAIDMTRDLMKGEEKLCIVQE